MRSDQTEEDVALDDLDPAPAEVKLDLEWANTADNSDTIIAI